MKYPFKFLDAYEKDDTDIFFGRKDEVNTLYRMLFESNIIWLYGASGTGKTSLVQCGLSSKFNHYDWFDLRITRGNNIVQSFEKCLSDAAPADSDDKEEISQLFEDVGIECTTLTSCGQTATQIANERKLKNIYLRHFRPIYLIFDQFEELFILGTRQEQDDFLEVLTGLLKTEYPVKILFCIREEYLGHLNRYERAIPSLLKKKLRLEPMDLGKIQEIMLEIDKLEISNVRISGDNIAAKEKLVELIFDKVRDNEKTRVIQLPYLQVFLDKLYVSITNDNSRIKEAVITIQDVEGMGNIDNVMRAFLDEQVTNISKRLQQSNKAVEDKTIWSILSHFVSIENTKEPILKDVLYQRVNKIEPRLIDEILDLLIKRKIIRYSDDTGLYEVAHDSLCSPIASKRNKVETDLLEVKQLISSQLKLYRKTETLFNQEQLQYVQPFIPELLSQNRLTVDETALLEESTKQIEIELLLEEEARQSELMDTRAQLAKEQILKRRSYYFLAVATLALIGMVFFAVKTNNLRKEAEALKENAVKQADRAIRSEQATTILYNEIKKQQILYMATSIEQFGDEYQKHKKTSYACENYRKAIELMKGYESDTVYKRIQQKLMKCNLY